MNQFTFHVVVLLLIVGGMCAVIHGPFWGYPVAVLLAIILAVFVIAYSTDKSLRRTLFAFGLFLTFGGLSKFLSNGFTPVTIHEGLPITFVGLACVYSAAFPYSDTALTESQNS